MSSARFGERTTRILLEVASIAHLVALALWLGGLAVLGAVVAPTVFGVVPLPTSADAMTLVFRRFDGLAVGCAAVALIAEGILRALGGRVVRNGVRVLVISGAAALALTEAAWLSPRIEALHREGAVRHVGDAGLALDRIHHLAESVAKCELVLLVIAMAMMARPSGGRRR